MFFDGIAECSQLFTQAVIRSVGIADRLCCVKMELSCAVEIFFTDADGNDLGKEHAVCAERNFLCDAALDIDRAFADNGRADFFALLRSQPHFLKFIHTAPAFYAAPVAGISQLFRYKVNDKFTCLFNQPVRMTPGTDGDMSWQDRS